jgi:hypothetical protein
MTRILIMIVLVIILLTSFSFGKASVKGIPSFVNQQYEDQTNDWEFVQSSTGTFSVPSPDGNITKFPSADNKEECKINDYVDIKGVSYNSDGETIHATLWVNPMSINQNTSYNQVRNSWITGGFQMPIDIPSIYDNGTDYNYKIDWHPLNKTWSRTFEERNIDRHGKNRIYDLSSENEESVDSRNSYLTFSLNRSVLELPDQFKIIFSAWGAFQNNEGRLCVITDSTSFIDIPPPLFNLSLSDLPSYIRKGQTITVPLRITSESGSNSQAILNALYNNDSIALKIIPSKVNIPPYSIADSLLEIEALDSKHPAQVTVNASISFPSSPLLRSGAILTTPSINNISEEVRFSLGILPELGLFDHVSNTLNTWGVAATQAIALVAGLGTAVTTILVVITRLRRPQEQSGKENI